jgi:hypothetical protein
MHDASALVTVVVEIVVAAAFTATDEYSDDGKGSAFILKFLVFIIYFFFIFPIIFFILYS